CVMRVGANGVAVLRVGANGVACCALAQSALRVAVGANGVACCGSRVGAFEESAADVKPTLKGHGLCHGHPSARSRRRTSLTSRRWPSHLRTHKPELGANARKRQPANGERATPFGPTRNAV